MKSSLSSLLRDPVGIGFPMEEIDTTKVCSEYPIIIPVICNRAKREMMCYIRVMSMRLNLEQHGNLNPKP
jgi:hypothetical protein